MTDYKEIFDTCVYTFRSENNILKEKDLGICGDIASILTPEHSVAAMECFQGCPYTNSGFRFDVIVDGEKVRTKSWEWLPNAMHRQGSTNTFDMETLTAVIPGMRTVIQRVTLKNKTDKEMQWPIQVMYRGRTRWEEKWGIHIPAVAQSNLEDYSADGRILSAETDEFAFHITSSLDGMRIFKPAYLWENEITVTPHGMRTFYFSAHMGLAEKSLEEVHDALDKYEELLEKSFEWLKKESRRIYDNLPRFSSDNPELDKLYYRSLVTYILCRWENPDLCSIPYFSTGSINGSCMCSYLWDYCGGLMLHPLYDSEGNKREIKALLKNDLTISYALNPVNGNAVGPWYQVNQEKIICMVYYHVLFTGEKEFLLEKAGEKTVLEWMKYHAYVCDDITTEVELYDYGEYGDDHLELRRGIPYNGIMPDLNARRYMNYMRVYELTAIAGEPDELLPKRATQLKEKLKCLWNDDAKWYDFISGGKRDIRYTVQMFKFLNSRVIDTKERDGLVSHLNETEFLSKFGLHSMSKLDEAYDQDDIDNGGGGICTHFTMQICAQLYEMGYDQKATDILRRVLWWGTRVPYMGDSFAANMVMNREDTPLQGDISSTACAQMIFYYIFGIKADFAGNITISPVKVRPAENMKIENARLCGKVFSVEILGERFRVTIEGKEFSAKIGEAVVI